jgi:hypothetical protein
MTLVSHSVDSCDLYDYNYKSVFLITSTVSTVERLITDTAGEFVLSVIGGVR